MLSAGKGYTWDFIRDMDHETRTWYASKISEHLEEEKRLRDDAAREAKSRARRRR